MTAPPALPPFSLFQIIRKVVRQIDSSGADDTLEHEEVIVEGPPEDPRELEADIDYFMRLAKVLWWPQPLRHSLFRVARHLYLLPASASTHSGFQSAPCSPLWALFGASLPAPHPGRQCFHHLRRMPFIFLPLCCLSLCMICPAFSLLLSPGGAERE